MLATLHPYWRLLLAGVRRQSTYRLAALGGLVANTTFGFLKVAVLFATVRAAGGGLKGYDIALMSSYVWLSQGMLGSVNLYGRSEFADRVKSGDVAVDLARPLNVQAAQVASEVGRSLFSLVLRGVPSVAIGLLVVGMAVPTTPAPYLLGAVSVLLGITISASSGFALACLGFWLVETRGVQVLYMVVSGFLSGLFVPLPLFPRWLRAVADATPFPSFMMHPIDVLSGRVVGRDAVDAVGTQCIWLVVMLVIAELLTRAGRRRLEVQGG